jgi:hypothetical protein
MAIDEETWEYLAAKQQAKYRATEPWNPDNFRRKGTTDEFCVEM